MSADAKSSVWLPALAFACLLVAASPAHAWQQGQIAPTGSMPMNMPGMDQGMDDHSNVMGASMEAMKDHLHMTAVRPVQPGDKERAEATVAQVRAAIEKYKDPRVATADGFIVANPDVKQPQYHFTNGANVQAAAYHFDPTKPSSLLYFKKGSKYELEGVMYTAEPGTSEDELNQRIPLSIGRWHEHINFCAAPADRVKEYLGAHPKYGMFGSLHTKEACEKERGTFMPIVFTWMIHIFPYESDMKQQFSMNDDVSHVR